MPPNQILTCNQLIKLVEEQKGSFIGEFRTLTPKEEARRAKADELFSKKPKRLNDKQRRARIILRNLKINVCTEVFLLCALATTPTGLGFSQLGDYIAKLSKWWAATDHPNGLRLVALMKYGELGPQFSSLDGPAHQSHVSKPKEDREQIYLQKSKPIGYTRSVRKSPPAQTGELTTEFLPVQTGRQISYKGSGAPISLMPLVGDLLFNQQTV